jgi:hypothetical protein
MPPRVTFYSPFLSGFSWKYGGYRHIFSLCNVAITELFPWSTKVFPTNDMDFSSWDANIVSEGDISLRCGLIIKSTRARHGFLSTAIRIVCFIKNTNSVCDFKPANELYRPRTGLAGEVSAEILTIVNLDALDRNRYFLFQVAPHLSSRGWVDSVPDPLPLRISDSTGNRTRDLWICSQELWPLDKKGSQSIPYAQ